MDWGSYGGLKEQNFKTFAIDRGIDLLGIQETNVWWTNVGVGLECGTCSKIGRNFPIFWMLLIY